MRHKIITPSRNVTNEKEQGSEEMAQNPSPFFNAGSKVHERKTRLCRTVRQSHIIFHRAYMQNFSWAHRIAAECWECSQVKRHVLTHNATRPL